MANEIALGRKRNVHVQDAGPGSLNRHAWAAIFLLVGPGAGAAQAQSRVPPPTADFTGMWSSTATVRRADRIQVGTRLEGVAQYSQEGDRVTGATTLGGRKSRLEGTVKGNVLRLESASVDENCPGVLQVELTMSTSGNLFTGWFSGTNCNGFVEATLVARRAGSTPADGKSPVVEILEEGEALLLGGLHEDAVKVFRKALKAADEPSYRIHIGLARSYNRIGAYKDGQGSAREALEVAQAPLEEAHAYFELGTAVMAGSNDQARALAEAEGAFRRAIELSDGQIAVARYRLGQVLLKLKRDPEGVEVLEEFLSSNADSPLAPQAATLVKNPRRAREALIPDFEAVTLDGRYLSSGDLENRVVLVDFWGTWCAPCVKAIPSLRRLSRRSASDPFVLLSISSDSDEALLKKFIAEHGMDWSHAWDKDRDLARLFEVRSWPTYFLFDHNGVFISRRSGWGETSESQLNNLVAKTIKAAKKASP